MNHQIKICLKNIFSIIKITNNCKVMKINVKKIEDRKIPINLYNIKSFSTPNPNSSEKNHCY